MLYESSYRTYTKKGTRKHRAKVLENTVLENTVQKNILLEINIPILIRDQNNPG